jgi:hypothetical protein
LVGPLLSTSTTKRHLSRVPRAHRTVMRDISPPINTPTHGALRAPGGLVDRGVDVRVNVLDQYIIGTGQGDPDGATTLDAVLHAVKIFEHYIDALNPRLRVTQRRTQSLTRVAIDVLTVIQVKATDIKTHDKTSVVGTNQAQSGQADETPHHRTASLRDQTKLAKPIMAAENSPKRAQCVRKRHDNACNINRPWSAPQQSEP